MEILLYLFLWISGWIVSVILFDDEEDAAFVNSAELIVGLFLLWPAFLSLILIFTVQDLSKKLYNKLRDM